MIYNSLIVLWLTIAILIFIAVCVLVINDTIEYFEYKRKLKENRYSIRKR